jgi:hypothetical protein
MEGLGIGRIVHYVLPDGSHRGEHRPAIVVRYWGETDPNDKVGMCNLQVFTDSDKDSTYNDNLPQVMWVTSAHFYSNDGERSAELGTWHWPEKS